MMIVLSMVLVVAVFWGDFLIWRRMRMDYAEDKIIELTLWLVGVIAGGGVLGFFALNRDLGFFWGAAVWAGTLALVGWCKRQNWDFWEWADQLAQTVIGVAAASQLVMLPGSWPKAVGLVIGWLVAKIVAANYRRFKWYLSGKMGFTALFVLMWWAGVEVVVAMFTGDDLYWVGLSAEQWVSAWTFTISLVILYLRSGRKLASEIPFVWLIRKKRKSRV